MNIHILGSKWTPAEVSLCGSDFDSLENHKEDYGWWNRDAIVCRAGIEPSRPRRTPGNER